MINMKHMIRFRQDLSNKKFSLSDLIYPEQTLIKNSNKQITDGFDKRGYPLETILIFSVFFFLYCALRISSGFMLSVQVPLREHIF
jgi:hypothetical protein